MFDQKTVIVLGAGASAPFGFPLGGPLYEQLIEQLGAFQRKLERTERPIFQLSFSAENVDHFHKDPLGALVGYLSSQHARDFLPVDFGQHDVSRMLAEFGEHLRNQIPKTIDRFINVNPRHQIIGKILLAQNILLPMYHTTGRLMTLKSYRARSIEKHPNWYHGLMNLMLDGVLDGESVANNRLTIVTFNYDQSLESALGSCLGSADVHVGADWRKAVAIYHVNGTPKSLQPTISDAGRFIVESAQTIALVGEKPSEELSDVRGKASCAIQDAEKVFVIGFNFDSANVAMIGLKNAPDPRVYCLNYDGNSGLAQRIRGLGIWDAHVKAGTPDNPMHIDRAIGEGFLEQG